MMRTNYIGQWKGSGRGQKGRGNTTYQVVRVGVAAVRHTLGHLFLALAPPPKDPTIAFMVRIYRLDQRVDGREQAGQQRTVSGGTESGNELLVAPDREHSRQKLLRHLGVKPCYQDGRGQEGLERLTSPQQACRMYEQRPHPVHPSWLHRENGAVRFHRRHLTQMGGSSSENPPARTTEREAKNVGACSSTPSNTAGVSAEASGSCTMLPRL
jgi:hypothetical protein